MWGAEERERRLGRTGMAMGYGVEELWKTSSIMNIVANRQS